MDVPNVSLISTGVLYPSSDPPYLCGVIYPDAASRSSFRLLTLFTDETLLLRDMGLLYYSGLLGLLSLLSSRDSIDCLFELKSSKLITITLYWLILLVRTDSSLSTSGWPKSWATFLTFSLECWCPIYISALIWLALNSLTSCESEDLPKYLTGRVGLPSGRTAWLWQVALFWFRGIFLSIYSIGRDLV